MLFGLCLGYDTAIVGPQASQACWRIARRRGASGRYVRGGALSLDALLEFCTRCPFVRAAVDPSQGSLGARRDGYGAPGAKTVALCLLVSYSTLACLERRHRIEPSQGTHQQCIDSQQRIAARQPRIRG